MIKINHLRKEYANITPLKDVNVHIHKGDVISIIGPSGTGKSTLIRCINMLETPTSGEIWVGDECITDKKCNINKIRQKMGIVFQSFNLFNHMNIIENIMAAPMDLLGKSKQDAYDEAIELLRTVGLADKAFNYPDELSGGQKQRVAIARALAMEPEIILLDEPTSALDPTMVGEVQVVIKDLAKRGLTLMIVTHEMKFAREVANRVFYMDEDKEFVYILMNKPVGVISATEDKKLPTVIDLLDERSKSYEPFPVGRLDIDTVGLLLLTNDGALSHELLSPKKHVPKTYFVKTEKEVTLKDAETLEKGVDIGGYITKPATVEILEEGINLTISEGKFHQVKKMLESVDNKVTYLKRISMGNLKLPENLEEGSYIEIQKSDIV